MWFELRFKLSWLVVELMFLLLWMEFIWLFIFRFKLCRTKVHEHSTCWCSNNHWRLRLSYLLNLLRLLLYNRLLLLLVMLSFASFATVVSVILSFRVMLLLVVSIVVIFSIVMLWIVAILLRVILTILGMLLLWFWLLLLLLFLTAWVVVRDVAVRVLLVVVAFILMLLLIFRGLFWWRLNYCLFNIFVFLRPDFLLMLLQCLSFLHYSELWLCPLFLVDSW